MKVTNLLEKSAQAVQDDEFSIHVLTGLSSSPKRISPKYLYDNSGSDLFQKITQQSDYYLTKKEFSILEKMALELPRKLQGDKEVDIIELGAGDGHKSKLLIDGFLKSGMRVNYYPIDISEEAMRMLGKTFEARENLEVHGIVADYFSGLSYLRSISKNRQMVLFLGSNIGNFERSHSLEFLRKLWKSMRSDDFVLVGFDLKKDIDVLNRAYNDTEGYTREFNLNLLHRINRELGGDFQVDNFSHYGFYNPIRGAMESYLISKQDQIVFIECLQKSFAFSKFEHIHLEYSFKFQTSDIELLCEQSGFKTLEHFSDSDAYFVDSLWTVVKHATKKAACETQIGFFENGAK